MERCKTCKHWERGSANYADKDEHAGGFCRSEKIGEDHGQGFKPDTLVYSYDEGGSFWTGAEFGCVNHEQAERCN